MHCLSLFLPMIPGTDFEEVLLCPGDGPDYYTPDEDFIVPETV